ncbi:hypothetical protein LEMLEM_LOCUS2736 [Lemmus lemmus]
MKRNREHRLLQTEDLEIWITPTSLFQAEKDRRILQILWKDLEEESIHHHESCACPEEGRVCVLHRVLGAASPRRELYGLLYKEETHNANLGLTWQV